MIDNVEEVVRRKKNSAVFLMTLLNIKYNRELINLIVRTKQKNVCVSYNRANELGKLIDLTNTTGNLVGVEFDRERLYYAYLHMLEKYGKVPKYDIVNVIHDLFKGGHFELS